LFHVDTITLHRLYVFQAREWAEEHPVPTAVGLRLLVRPAQPGVTVLSASFETVNEEFRVRWGKHNQRGTFLATNEIVNSWTVRR
jgi:hypothetical protein